MRKRLAWSTVSVLERASQSLPFCACTTTGTGKRLLIHLLRGRSDEHALLTRDVVLTEEPCPGLRFLRK